MRALITGATSGIGLAFAQILAKQGFSLILASRNTEKMKQLQKKLPTQVEIMTVDLSSVSDCYRLHNAMQGKQIDIVINNAGFGVYGDFTKTDLSQELNMLDLNVRAVHILTKLFLQDFVQRDYGYILNVASSAGFFAGPLMASYYAGKNYVLRLTEAIHQELQQTGSRVQIAALCPGPVETAFYARAHHAPLHGISAKQAALAGLKGIFSGKCIILPDTATKAIYVLQRFLPEAMLLHLTYTIQKRKEG